MNLKGIFLFVVEFALAAGVSTSAYRIGYRMLHADSDWATGFGMAGIAGIAILLGLSYALPYGLAAVVFLVGLKKRRLGLILGPLAFGLGLWLLSSEQVKENEVSLVESAAAARALDQRSFLPLQGNYDIVAADGEGSCHQVCRQILAQTTHAFATKRFNFDEAWELYRRIEGESCLRPENRASYLEFLGAGYVGLCASREKWEPAGTVLLVSGNENNSGEAQKIVGPGYEGYVFEAYERRGGTDRLLGRWIAGTLYAQRNQFDPMSISKHEQIGARFDAEDFYAALLGIPIKSNDVTGPASTEALLDALLPLIDEFENGRKARQLVSQTVRRAGESDLAPLLKRIEALLSDSDRDRMLVGLRILGSVNGAPPLGFAKPFILKALASGDAELASEALKAMHSFPRDDRSFAAEPLVALAFDPILRAPGNPVMDPLFSHLRSRTVPFPADARAKALERIRGGDTLSEEEMTILLLILGRKHEGPHEAFFDLIRSLEGQNFETAVDVVGGLGWSDLEGGELNRWTDAEIKVLIERASEVPDERFKNYIGAFRFQPNFDSMQSILIREVERRIAVLRRDPVANKDQIKKFERLRDIIPENIAG